MAANDHVPIVNGQADKDQINASSSHESATDKADNGKLAVAEIKQNGDSIRDDCNKMADTYKQNGNGQIRDSDKTAVADLLQNKDAKVDSGDKMEIVDLKKTGEGKETKDLLMVPRSGQRKSFMEEECAKERTRQSLLKQCSAILKQSEEKYNKETLHRTFQDEDLLERLFRLFDSEQRGHLDQDAWLQFLKQRLTEEKQVELVEQLESVAYVVCGGAPVHRAAFATVMRNKVVTNKLLKAVDADGDGVVSADELMEFLSAVTSSRPRAGFDKRSVDRLEQLFRRTVGDRREITREQFRTILDSKNIFDEDNSGTISLQEFIAAAHRFAGQTPDDKIRFLFEVYDMDGDGLIQQRELQHVLWACCEENGMQFSEQQLAQLTRAMFEDADAEGRGAITFEALRDQLAKHDGLLENLSISIDRWLVPPAPPAPRRLRPYQLSLSYVRNNFALLGYLVLFAALNAGLFIARCEQYSGQGAFLMLARASGQCLNFDSAWVLVLMLRRLLTWLRARGLGDLLPLDHHVYLHKLTGVLVLLLALLHTVMHLLNFGLVVVNDPALNAQNWTYSEWILTERPGHFGLVAGCANPTGVALLLLLLLVCGCSQPCVRRRGSFEVFYWTHLLYVPFWLLLIFHAPNFWKWFIVPGAIYIVEKIIRLIWLRSERGRTYASAGALLPSRVTHLLVKRPPLFRFHAGDYVYVCVPAIARCEWHPFTISSAPELPDYIWLHIRGVGEWTNRLYAYFEQEHARLSAPTLPPATSDPRGDGGVTPARGVDNPGFCGDSPLQPDTARSSVSPRGAALLAPLRMHKTRSMPDVYKQRHLALRDYMRSESENRFDPSEVGRARVVGEAGGEGDRRSQYSALQSRAAAHSFRYLRHRPALVALRPPRQDQWPRRSSNESIITIARRRLSKSLSPDKDVEAEKAPESDTAASPTPEHPADFPIGKPLEVYVDGPYGAAASHIFGAQHAALIAAGIGVTPFASILQAIMYRYWSARTTCPRCGLHYTAQLPHHDMSLTKVDFFWINREQRSFEWFVSLLSQLEIEQAELAGGASATSGGANAASGGASAASGGDRFLDMHMYITSALQRTDMKAVGLQLALDLLHQKEKRDLITGLKTRTNAGRPNWDKVFQQLRDQNKGKVTVFYCGPPQLGRALRRKAAAFGFHFRKETF